LKSEALRSNFPAKSLNDEPQNLNDESFYLIVEPLNLNDALQNLNDELLSRIVEPRSFNDEVPRFIVELLRLIVEVPSLKGGLLSLKVDTRSFNLYCRRVKTAF
jgi:hypothetical protein